MSTIHFGYVVFDEGTPEQSVRVLIAQSLEGLEAQAYNFGKRLRREDWVRVEDLEDYDAEEIAMAEDKMRPQVYKGATRTE
jgi:hypothetical protein